VEADEVAGRATPDDAIRWVVHRQDDNGNRYVVSRHAAKEEADRVAAELDARGHKQLCWVEPE